MHACWALQMHMGLWGAASGSEGSRLNLSQVLQTHTSGPAFEAGEHADQDDLS